MKKLKDYFVKQQFIPNFFSIFFNPFYIARNGLYKNIKKISNNITGKTLDVGCGIKPYENLFSSTVYIGMDIEQSGHDHSNSKVDVFYDGTNFPFPDNSFDSVVSNQVLEHVFNPELFLKEINRVLKPNGKLLLTVPFVWDEHEQPYDFARYTSYGIIFLLKQHNFEVITSVKSVRNIAVIFQLLNMYWFKILSFNMVTKLLSLILIIPFNILGLFFSLVLPNNNDLYLDNIILVKKNND